MKIKSKILIPVMFLLMSFYLSACGGAAGTLIADGGITGTGITMGRITNFGSIFVNGVHFDVDSADFVRDGLPSSDQTEFSVGEYVVIKGSVDAAGTTGTATEVSFTDSLEGEVTVGSSDNSTIEILGQTVKTDQLTVFIGFNLLTDLVVKNIVEVSGVKDAAGIVQATSIKLKEAFVQGVSENEVKGTIDSINLTEQTFMINNIRVDYAGAVLEGFGGEDPQNGQFVEVKSNLMITGNTLIAFEVELADEYQSFPEDTEVEIEGLVTRFASSADFDVNGLTVTTTIETEFENGVVNDIALNSFLEIEGKVNILGVLVAEEVSFKDTESAIEFEGNIQTIDIANNLIEVSDKKVVIDATTLMVDESVLKVSPLTINDLAIGDPVEVIGSLLDNGNILASKLEREDGEEEK